MYIKSQTEEADREKLLPKQIGTQTDTYRHVLPSRKNDE